MEGISAPNTHVIQMSAVLKSTQEAVKAELTLQKI